MVDRLVSSFKRKSLKSLKWVIPVFVISIICFEFDEIFKGFNWGLFEYYYDRLTSMKIVILLTFGVLALLPMFFYDVILIRLFGICVPKGKLSIFSLSANAYSNFVGFGGVAGATLRTYFYQPYIRGNLPYIKTIAKLSLFYLTGLSILCWFIMFGFFDSWIFLEFNWLKSIVFLMALYTPIFSIVLIFMKSFWGFNNQGKPLFIELMMTSFFEWLFVVIWIWGITEIFVVPITFKELFPIVVLSSCAGIISMIPGGVGSFDLIFLTGFELYGVPTELSLLIILFYRISYYVIPFLLGTPLAIVTMYRKWKQK